MLHLLLATLIVASLFVALPAFVPPERPQQDANAAQAPSPTAAPTAVPTTAPTRETRALWVSRFDFETQDDLRTVVERAASANLNVIFFQVRGQADALYTPGLEPWSASLSGTLGKDPGYDPLAMMLDLAHARGIEVHAWVNVYPAWLGATPPPASATPTPMYHEFNQRFGQDWVQWTRSGPQQLSSRDYLSGSPANPAVVDRVVAVCRDIVTRYPVDGVHLDYIRYAGPEYSYDPVSNNEYARAGGQDPNLTRDDFQRDQVTGLVRRMGQEVLPLRPGARLSATAWPAYIDRWGWFNGRGGFNAFFQDSQGWAKNGLVAAITPMLYSATVHDHLDRFQTLAQDYVSGSQPGTVFMGIGGDYDSFDQIAQRIDIARSLGAQGQALFSYRALEERNYWDDLRAGPYSQPAQANWG